MASFQSKIKGDFLQQFREGLVLHKQGDLRTAEKIYEKILPQGGFYSDIIRSLKLVASQTRRLNIRLELLKNAMRHDKKYERGYEECKNAIMKLKPADIALATLEDYTTKILDLRAGKDHVILSQTMDYAVAYKQLGDALCVFQCFDDALPCYDNAIELNPNCADTFLAYGIALLELDRLEKALVYIDRAIRLKQDFSAFVYRGIVLRKLDRLEESIASFDMAIKLSPRQAWAFHNRAITLNQLDRFEEALVCYDKAILLWPHYVEAHFNKALALLLRGQFERGWAEYEWRNVGEEALAHRSYVQPTWTGDEDISGKTILVHSEQGLGDTIQFCRYVKILEQSGAKVLFAPQKSLQKLMQGLSGGSVHIIDVDGRSFCFDYHCLLMSLPLAFKTKCENIPADIPYLTAQSDRVHKWKERIGADGLKIGISWQGRTGKVDVGRSFSINEFRSVSQLPGVRLISLQKGAGAAQLAELPRGMKVETLGEEFDAGPDAFLDTAAVIKCCDLVITSDTAIAHLGGALGAPTWVVLKYMPEWRWMLHRNDSPWYPTMRLFRQKVDGDWKSVFKDIESKLVQEYAKKLATRGQIA